jgi:hypothetical protein
MGKDRAVVHYRLFTVDQLFHNLLRMLNVTVIDDEELMTVY